MPRTRRQKADLLWEALSDLESRRGSRAFQGEYKWSYSHESKTAPFDAAFVRQLNDTDWVPDGNDELLRPEFVVFDTLGWKPKPLLESKIHFKPSIIESLAKEVGIEPGVLDLLKKHGVTSVIELKALLGIKEEPQQPKDAPQPTPPVTDPKGLKPSSSGDGGVRGSGADGRTVAGDGAGTQEGTKGGAQMGDRTLGAGTGTSEQTPGSTGGRPFISYVGAHPNEDEPDPDDLDQQARMALEEKAIKHILAQEPELQRTPPHNPGYDLFEVGEDGGPVRWVEVKSMTGCLNDRPVGLSRTQFECARGHGDAYWLYVVEHAGDDSARIVRIQDPARKARTFTFDHGWIDVAVVDVAAD